MGLIPLLLGVLFTVPATNVLPVAPEPPKDYLEAHLSPYTDELSARDPYPYEDSKPVAQIVQEIFGKDAPMALKVFTCESGLSPTSTNKSAIENSIGVAQINSMAHRDADPLKLYDAEYNIKYAKGLYDKESWRPWSCYSILTGQKE